MENNESIVAIVAAIHGKVVIIFLSLLFRSFTQQQPNGAYWNILLSPEPYFLITYHLHQTGS